MRFRTESEKTSKVREDFPVVAERMNYGSVINIKHSTVGKYEACQHFGVLPKFVQGHREFQS